jgi:4-hydroxy-tetrahydrodipicolinate synthase
VTTFTFGLVHAPLTPFADEAIDYDGYGKLIDFHLQHGAEGLAIPTHTGESVSLTVDERQALLDYVIKQVGGRVPAKPAPASRPRSPPMRGKPAPPP